MDMEGAVRARLLAAVPVTAIVGQRVYWEDRPQTSPLPAVVLQLPTDLREQHMGGFQGLLFARIQVNVLGTSFADKKRLKEAVIAALVPAQSANGIRFTRATDISSRPINERTETQYIFADAVDFQLHYATT